MKKLEYAFVVALAGAFLVWGGTKPPTPPVITEQGIKITAFSASANEVVFAWETEDERLVGAEFLVQSRRVGSYTWETIGRTSEKSFTWQKFSVDKSRDYRIIVDITDEE